MEPCSAKATVQRSNAALMLIFNAPKEEEEKNHPSVHSKFLMQCYGFNSLKFTDGFVAFLSAVKQ